MLLARGERVIQSPDLALGILAGGAGRRFGGLDKGWIEVDGVPQVVRLLDAFAPQAAQRIVSANRTLDRYRALGVDVVADPSPDYPGPLAGVVALLQACRRGCLLTLPVDIERWPADLAVRLLDVAARGQAAYAVDDEGPQPLVACYPIDCAELAACAFAAGERSVRRWQASLGATAVQFDGFRFGNHNQPRH